LAEEAFDLGGGGVQVQRLQADLAEEGHASHVGQPAVQWMALRAFLGPASGEQDQALVAETGDQVRQHVE
jgi:hypothetical protein